MHSRKPLPVFGVIVTLCCAVIFCPGCMTPNLSRAADAPDLAVSTYHGDSGLKGFSSTDLPDKPEQLWQFNANARIIATPVTGNGRVYFSSAPATVRALDLKGKELWTTQLKVRKGEEQEKDDEVTAPPMYLNETVIIGGLSGTVHALNAQTGQTRWKFDAGAGIQGSANCLNKDDNVSIIMIAQPSSSRYAIDPATGQLAWQTTGTIRSDGCPAVDARHIVFGSCAAALHVCSSEDGSELGRIPLGEEGEIAGGVALDGNHVFSGSRRGTLACFDLNDMDIAWTNNTVKGELFTTPALTGDRVVFAGAGYVCCADRKTGKTLWTFETKTGEPQSPFIANNKVVAAAGGNVYLLAINDGKLLWSAEISDNTTGPAVADGMIVLGTDDGRVVAFGKK